MSTVRKQTIVDQRMDAGPGNWRMPGDWLKGLDSAIEGELLSRTVTCSG